MHHIHQYCFLLLLLQLDSKPATDDIRNWITFKEHTKFALEAYHTCTRRRENFEGIGTIVKICFRNTGYTFGACEMVWIMSHLRTNSGFMNIESNNLYLLKLCLNYFEAAFIDHDLVVTYYLVQKASLSNQGGLCFKCKGFLLFQVHQSPKRHCPKPLYIFQAGRNRLYTCTWNVFRVNHSYYNQAILHWKSELARDKQFDCIIKGTYPSYVFSGWKLNTNTRSPRSKTMTCIKQSTIKLEIFLVLEAKNILQKPDIVARMYFYLVSIIRAAYKLFWWRKKFKFFIKQIHGSVKSIQKLHLRSQVKKHWIQMQISGEVYLIYYNTPLVCKLIISIHVMFPEETKCCKTN